MKQQAQQAGATALRVGAATARVGAAMARKAAPHLQRGASGLWAWLRADNRRMIGAGVLVGAVALYLARRWKVPTFPAGEVPRTKGPTRWPLTIAGKITSLFGSRKDPTALVFSSTEAHPGLDISAPQGTPVVAAGDGVVVTSERKYGGYGNRVVIRHDNGMTSTYNHLVQRQVAVGERVVTGQAVGAVGTTGESTGPHLHFEILGADGKFVNPAAVVSPIRAV